MKIKVFTTDKNGKISFSKDELQEIINEAYWEGYTNGSKDRKTWTVSTPWLTPYYTWSTTASGSSSLTIGESNSITNNSITIDTKYTNNTSDDSITNNTATIDTKYTNKTCTRI